VIAADAIARSRSLEAAARPTWAVALHTLRSTHRGALIWGAVFGFFALASATAYMTGFPTQAARAELARTLQTFAILLGPPRNADTVAGFTAWRVLLVGAVMGAIWAMLTSTSRLRGDEDDGRWELLLAAPLTKRAATLQVLLGLGGAWLLMFAVSALLIVLTGRLPGARFSLSGSLLLAAGMSAGAAMWLAIGALASQISATRGQAVRLAAALLGASFLVRMLADSRTSLGWLRWLSPLGWIEELHPFRNSQPQALLPMLVLIVGSCALAIVLAERRDLNASLIQEGQVRRHETAWSAGPFSLALRLAQPSAIGWLVGSGVLAFITGAVAKSASSILTSSPTFEAALGRLGIRKAAEGYLGLTFMFVAVLLAVLAAGQIAAMRDEEGSGRLENLLVRPVTRATWLSSRVGVALLLIVSVGLASGLLTWLGAASSHVGVGLSALLAAGLNACAPAVVVLGAGVLVLGWRARLAAPAAYALVAWSFLVNLLGSFLKGLDWLRQTSILTHMSLAPSVAPDWGADLVMLAIGLAAAIVGGMALKRRDLEYG